MIEQIIDLKKLWQNWNVVIALATIIIGAHTINPKPAANISNNLLILTNCLWAKRNIVVPRPNIKANKPYGLKANAWSKDIAITLGITSNE